MKKNLIINAFAYIENYKSSENINNNNAKQIIDTYMNLSIVSLISAKINNPNDDVALITNYNINENYTNMFSAFGIKIIKIEFNDFIFDKNLKWNLAFFKLCALKYVVNNLDYNSYLLLDSDTYVQNNLNNLFEEASQKILLYNMQHSLEIRQAINMNNEYNKLFKTKKYLTNYGGEFICGNKKNLLKFFEECDKVYKLMKYKNFKTEHGDEFIISSAAVNIAELIKDGGAYIYRYWTRNFYFVSTNFKFNPVSILHLPDEKNYSLIWLSNYIIKNKKLPKNEIVWKKFGLGDAKRKKTLDDVIMRIKNKIIKKLRNKL